MGAKVCLTVFICGFIVVSAHACEWPDFFMIPPPETGDRFSLDEAETSWETMGQIRRNTFSYINADKIFNTWVRPIGRNTIKMTNVSYEDPVPQQYANVTILTCVKDFGDAKYLVKVNDRFSSKYERSYAPTSYQCIQLVRRSPFVLQWRRGPEVTSFSYLSDVMDCPDGFAELSPWPLIYYPIRRVSDVTKAEGYPRLHEQYQPCPRLGGFHMEVLDASGEPVKSGCRNNDPSPRLELECYHGDGMRILQTRKNCTEYSKRDDGAKLNCLGTWEDGEYSFSVLKPNDANSINSFHCLRLDRRKPTSQNAILFLDATCQAGDLTNTSAFFFQLRLRRQRSPGLCNDFSDQCSADKCDKMPYSCAQTCNKCPFSGAFHFILKKFDKSIRGQWMLPLATNLQKTLYIVEYEVLAFDIGYFTSYSLIHHDSQCLNRPSGWAPIHEYVLAGPGEAPGCVPRVSQLRARRISQSVLLLQMPSPSPLRQNSDYLTPSKWCHNNYRDVVTFRPLFRPYSSYISHPFSSTGNVNGYLTLVSKNYQMAAPTCIDFEKRYKLRYVAHLDIILQFNNVTCEGESTFNGSTWQLKYTCPDGAVVDKALTCLGDYQVSADYHAVVLKAPVAVNETEPLSLDDIYYCLLIPFGIAKGRPILLNHAANCDASFVNFASLKLRDFFAALVITERKPTISTTDKSPITDDPNLQGVLRQTDITDETLRIQVTEAPRELITAESKTVASKGLSIDREETVTAEERTMEGTEESLVSPGVRVTDDSQETVSKESYTMWPHILSVDPTQTMEGTEESLVSPGERVTDDSQETVSKESYTMWPHILSVDPTLHEPITDDEAESTEPASSGAFEEVIGTEKETTEVTDERTIQVPVTTESSSISTPVDAWDRETMVDSSTSQQYPKPLVGFLDELTTTESSQTSTTYFKTRDFGATVDDIYYEKTDKSYETKTVDEIVISEKRDLTTAAVFPPQTDVMLVDPQLKETITMLSYTEKEMKQTPKAEAGTSVTLPLEQTDKLMSSESPTPYKEVVSVHDSLHKPHTKRPDNVDKSVGENEISMNKKVTTTVIDNVLGEAVTTQSPQSSQTVGSPSTKIRKSFDTLEDMTSTETLTFQENKIYVDFKPDGPMASVDITDKELEHFLSQKDNGGIRTVPRQPQGEITPSSTTSTKRKSTIDVSIPEPVAKWDTKSTPSISARHTVDSIVILFIMLLIILHN